MAQLPPADWKDHVHDYPQSTPAGTMGTDVIYHNMNVNSDFKTMRAQHYGTLAEQLVKLTEYCKSGCFDEIISVSGSEHSFVVVVATTVSWKDLNDKGFPSMDGGL